jgi:hypothetical protein
MRTTRNGRILRRARTDDLPIEQPALSVVAKWTPGSGMGCTMSTMIREQDGFITIYDHYSKKLMMIELYGLQKKISRETWPDAASATKAFYAGEFTWDESGA